MNDPLNEILMRVTKLSPSELELLLETTQSLQRQAKSASDSGLCVDSDAAEKNDDLLIEKI